MTKNTDNAGDTELGNYRILKQDGALWTLGKGAFGTTYKAEHKHLGGAYALKIINDQFNDSEQVKQRFLREAKATFSLSSTKIARVHDFGVEGGVFYYVLDYCDGGNLQEYSLANGAQPWSVVRNVALQILEAVSEAHQNGFLHRDLKPSNIMLQRPDDIDSLKLIDFGMVKALEESGIKTEDSMLTVQGSFMGNPLTASPEQLHEFELDERSDLFSLGVTLWYVLCGGSPFGGAATASLVHTRLQEEEYSHQLPDDLEEDGKYILGRLLSKKKEDRFATAEDVIRAIREEQCAAEAGEMEADLVAEVGQELDLELIHHFSYGDYFYATNEAENETSTLYKPNSSSVPQLELALLESKLEGNQVIQFVSYGEHNGERVYYCEPLLRGKLSGLLKSHKKLNIEDYRLVFEKLGKAIDQASNAGFTQLELDDKFIHLGDTDHPHKEPLSEEEWSECVKSDKLEVMILPRLAPNDDSELNMKTIAGEDLAPDSVTGFAALVYRLHTGMPIKQTAFLSKTAYVPSSLFSEESNDYLREVIGASEHPESCAEMFHHLYELNVNGKSMSSEDSKISNSVEIASPVVVDRASLLKGDTVLAREDEVAERKEEEFKKVEREMKPQTKTEARAGSVPKDSTSVSKGKTKGVIAAGLLVAVGVVGYQVFQAKNTETAVAGMGGGSEDSHSEEGELVPAVGKVELDPEAEARNEKLQQEALAAITEIKDLVGLKQYNEALAGVDALEKGEWAIETSVLRAEIEGLIGDELNFTQKQQEEAAKQEKLLAELEEKQKLNAAKEEKEALEARQIWQKETATERDMLLLANTQKEKSLNFIATNQPLVKVKKLSDDGNMWEARVELRRPGNTPKEITLKFNKNKLLKKNSEAIVKVLGPHVEKVEGEKLFHWQLVVKDAQLEKQLVNFNHLVTEQKKTLFLKQQSIRKKYPHLAKYFPQ
ncbi:MAG: protein kinase domain-containing protein [Akkermansiaceae bacterium]